jgi:hypothetical protein
MGAALFPKFVRDNYHIHEWRHGIALLKYEFPSEWNDIVEVLTAFRLKKNYITEKGGRKSEAAKFIDSYLIAQRGWAEKKFKTVISVDDHDRPSPTHSVDCFKNRVAFEVEWNNKDPFYDRDLNNFRLLFDLRAISIGVIFTRGDELQQIFDSLGRGKSYGASTTHMSKLLPRIEGGSGGGCPLIAFGIKSSLFVP